MNCLHLFQLLFLALSLNLVTVFVEEPVLNLVASSLNEKENPEILASSDIYALPEKLITLKEFNAIPAIQQQYWIRFLNED